MISIIVATSANNAIGKDNRLLWHISEDLRHFKTLTLGKAVIMGRKTFDSIGFTLPQRHNIVITSNRDWHTKDVEVYHNLSDALAVTSNIGGEVVIAGGAQIYAQTMPLADRIYQTVVNMDCQGDVYFPEIHTDIWKLMQEEKIVVQERTLGEVEITFKQWDRMNNKKDIKS